MDVIKSLAKELAEVKREAAQGQLLPLPGQTVESCSLELGATSKTVGSSMAQLLTAANQGNENYTGIAARDTANALQVCIVLMVVHVVLWIGNYAPFSASEIHNNNVRNLY